MLRRIPTSIELKLDDVVEYELARKEQAQAKKQSKSTNPYNEPPNYQPGPKPKEEIYKRIGFNPQTRHKGLNPPT